MISNDLVWYFKHAFKVPGKYMFSYLYLERLVGIDFLK